MIIMSVVDFSSPRRKEETVLRGMSGWNGSLAGFVSNSSAQAAGLLEAPAFGQDIDYDDDKDNEAGDNRAIRGAGTLMREEVVDDLKEEHACESQTGAPTAAAQGRSADNYACDYLEFLADVSFGLCGSCDCEINSGGDGTGEAAQHVC